MTCITRSWFSPYGRSRNDDDVEWKGIRVAMGHARAGAERVELASMRPAGERVEVDLSAAEGDLKGAGRGR